MIDFRYHLVSIVAVFLALAIGIVLGSTELQGTTIDALQASVTSLKNQLSHASADRDSYKTLSDASARFLTTAEPKLVAGYLRGDRVLIITEPGASSAVTGGVRQAALDAGATVTGTLALQPKFNDLSAGGQASLSALNTQLAALSSTTLTPAVTAETGHQQQAAQLITGAVLDKATAEGALTAGQAQQILQQYAQNGYLTVTGTLTDRATLAVLVTPGTASATGSADPVNQVLLTAVTQFAAGSAVTLVAGSVAGSSSADSAIQVLRGSSVSGQVSTVDNADTTLGQISAVWALYDQLAGQKPGSYGISGAAAVSPVPLSVPTSTASAAPTATATGKVKKTVGKK